MDVVNGSVDPSALGRCTACGSVYPLRRTEDGWRAVGTDGECGCGGGDFVPIERE